MSKEIRQIDQYLRGELTAEEAARVAELLERSDSARAYAEWLEQLGSLTDQARIQPPESVVREMEARLLNLAQEMATGAGPVSEPGAAGRRTLRVPVWLAAPSPLLRAAAVLIVGVLIGYGLWGPQRATEPLGREAPGVSARKAADAPEADAVAASAPVSEETTRNLLSVAADLKAERKSADDVRMTRLLGQIESVLMEMDRLGRERDLSGARHVASVIEQQGLLSTLQRLKVGLEE
jgi:anti-sigma factor RsiW